MSARGHSHGNTRRRRAALTGVAALGLTLGTPLVPVIPTESAHAPTLAAPPALPTALVHAMASTRVVPLVTAMSPAPPAPGDPMGVPAAPAAAPRATAPAVRTLPTAVRRPLAPARPPVSIPRAGRVIQLRPTDVRLLVDGRLVGQRFRRPGRVSLTELARLAGRPEWLSTNRRVALLRAAIYQAPGTALTITAADARTLRLQQDATGYGGIIEGTGAGLTVDGVTVVGWDGARGRPAAANRLRPYLEYHRGSQLGLRNATFAHLGRPVALQEGVSLYDGAAVFAAGTSFANSRTGLLAVRTAKVRLDRVSALANATNGITVRSCPAPLLRRVSAIGNRSGGVVVDGSVGPVLASVRAVRNAGAGVSVRNAQRIAASGIVATENGSDGLHLRSVSGGLVSNAVTTRNRRAGVELLSSDRLRVRQIRSTANQGAGVDVTGSTSLRLEGLTSTSDVAGLLVRAGSADVVADGVSVDRALTGLALGGPRIHAADVTVDRATTALLLARDGVAQQVDQLRVRRSGLGVQVAAGNRDAVLRRVDIQEPARVGIDLQGTKTRLDQATVQGGQTAVLVRGNATGVALDGVTARSVRTGVTIQSLVSDVSVAALRVEHADLGLESGAARTRVRGAAMTDVATGVKVRGDAFLEALDVEARDCAVRAVDTTPQLHGGAIRALRAVCGSADMDDTRVLAPRTPNGYGLFAGAMVVLAVAYELLRRGRERPRRARLRAASKEARA